MAKDNEELDAAFIEHFGIPGMKWGVRKATPESVRKTARRVKRSEARQARRNDAMDRRWKKKSLSFAARVKAYNHGSDEMNKPGGTLSKINNSKKYKGKNLLKDKKLYEQYNKDIMDAFVGHVNKYLTTSAGTSPSGTKKLTAEFNSEGRVMFIVDEVKHISDNEIQFEVKRDPNGFVIKFVPVAQELTQSEITELDVAYIEHFGIPGMKWGVRKARDFGSARKAHFKRSVAQKYGQRKKGSDDYEATRSLRRKKLKDLSNEDLKKLTTRLNLERNYKSLTKKDTSAGAKFVGEVLKEFGKQQASKYVSEFAGPYVETFANVVKEKVKG